MSSAARSLRSIVAIVLVFMLLFLSPAPAALAALRPVGSPQAAVVLADDWDPTAAGVDFYAPDTVQIAGATRLETAIAVSKFGWSQSDTVVIATARQFPDALVGGPLAALLDAPILLTEPGKRGTDRSRAFGPTGAAAAPGWQPDCRTGLLY